MAGLRRRGCGAVPLGAAGFRQSVYHCAVAPGQPSATAPQRLPAVTGLRKKYGSLSMQSIDVFPWNDHFDTGLAEIDRQHRKLVELLNALASHLAYRTELPELHAVIDALMDYTHYHFETEERIWHEFLPGDADEVEHKRIHAGFVETVRRIKSEAAAKSAEQVVQDALAFLARWLASHILETDKRMAFVVLALQSGLDVGAAKRRADEQMGGAARALIDLILSIYGTLSSTAVHLMREIAEHRQANEALRTEERRFRAIIDASPVPMALNDDRGNIVYVNAAFAKAFGYTLDDIPTLSDWWPRAYPDAGYRQWVAATWKSRLDEARRNKRDFEPLEVVVNAKDGRVCTVIATASSLGESFGGQHLVTLYDISERKRQEAELQRKDTLLIQQSRLAAMGEMIGNIAHQWRQPLSVLGLTVQNLRYDFKEGRLDEAGLDQYVGKALKAVDSMSSTIDDFRDFFKPNREAESFSPLQALRECGNLIEPSLKASGIELAIDAPPHLEVKGYPNEFAQVILNLISNAKDVIVERKVARGRIEVRAADIGDGVTVTVEDNAGGVRGDHMEKIFDPYFTTKDKGTGIGLYMCRTIIEQHMHGSIRVENTDAGARFTLRLPKNWANDASA